MDGLIPFLFHAMKKHSNNNNKPHHHHHRRSMSFSEGSTRSYHLLVQPDSFSGSSHHRRTRSEFQMPPPAAADFSGQTSGQHDLLRSSSLRKRHAPVSIPTAGAGGESKYAVAGSKAAAGNVNVNDGRGAMHGGH
ncbi:unnamed protein product [Linum tenue]|uniref:Uncharacterized protein n=1 Tax=Linum tenue TaxID=586396 RepID=A0AAV0PHZ7_9ROSI|nr:unnamed protein product [Linum tenue]